MTVKELIKELEKMPQDLTVACSLGDGWGGTNEIEFVEIEDNSRKTIVATGEHPPNRVILF